MAISAGGAVQHSTAKILMLGMLKTSISALLLRPVSGTLDFKFHVWGLLRAAPQIWLLMSTFAKARLKVHGAGAG